MDALALVVSVLALLVSAGSAYMTNERSKEAFALTMRAAVEARWSALQEAVQRLRGFDPAADPLSDRLANMRLAAEALVDDLPEASEVGRWLEAEQALGAAYARVISEVSRPTDSVEQTVQNVMPLTTWATILHNDLRSVRMRRYDSSTLQGRADDAHALIRQVYEQRGWGVPPVRYRDVDGSD